MLDTTSSDVFSDNEADAIMASCDPNITPIFPVRYALTSETLTSVKNSTPNIPTPSGLGGGAHDLRRLRSGYVYIYAHGGHPVEAQTEQEAIWLVFRYETVAGDANSETRRSDTETDLHGSYVFTQYTALDGLLTNRWEADNSRRFPYAYVHRDVSKIHIAYSEERWPVWFFQQLGRSQDLRDKLMTEVELTAERTAHSAPLSEIAQHVTGFKGEEADPVENAIRHSALQPEEPRRVINCPNAQNNGILVALMDPLGEILDLGRVNEILAQSQKSYAEAYAYPLTTGAAVLRHQAQIVSDTEGGFIGALRNNPIRNDFTATYNSLVDGQSSIEASLNRTVAAMRRILMREGPGGLIEEHRLAFQGLEGIENFAEFDRAEYGAFILARALEPFAASPRGSAHIAGIVDPTAGEQTPVVAAAFQATMNAYSKFNWEAATRIRQTLNPSRAPHFDVLIEATANEVATHWVRTTGDPRFIKGAVQRVGGVVQSGTQGVPAANLDRYIRTQFRNLGFAGVPAQAAEIHGGSLIAAADFDDVLAADGVNIPQFSQGSMSEFTNQQAAVLIEPNTNSATALATEGRIQRVGQGVGIAVALVIAFSASQSWDTTRYTVSSVGALAEDPKIILSAAVLDMFAASARLAEIRSTQAFMTTTSREVFSRLFIQSRYLTPQVVSTGVRTSSTATATRIASSVLGRIAGAISVILAGFAAWEAWQTGDYSSFAANTLLAIGALIMLWFGATIVGAIVGVVLIVIGIALSIFSYSPIEKWVATSFWGESWTYWDVSRADTEELIDTAKALANPSAADHDRIKEFFEQEMLRYQQIVVAPRVINATNGDNAVEVDYPLADSESALDDLDVVMNFWCFSRNATTQSPNHSISSNNRGQVTISYVSPGVFRARISDSQLALIDRLFRPGTEFEISRVRVAAEIDEKRSEVLQTSWPI